MRRAVLLLTILLVGACDASPPPEEAPALANGEVVSEGVAVALPNPRLRYPAGARVVRVDADGTRAVLSDGLAAAGAPSVHHDGDRVLFVGQASADDSFRVYDCAADGSDRRVLVDHGTDCVRAAYLPDGRIVYAAALPGISPAGADVPRTALFVADGQGEPGERITFGADVDTDPTVLSDGRVLFASWRPAAPGGRGRLGLFTVHPDGTGYTPFHLAEVDASYPVQRADLDVRFRVHDPGGPAREHIADWDAPMGTAAMADEMRHESVPLAARTRPQGQLSSVKPDRPYGTLVCVDARANGATDAARVQLATFGGERVVLGRTDLAADGSFMVQVPPDTPLVIQLLDAENRLVREEHGPFWVRPNEARVCVTCHDDIENAPPNRRPMAVLGDPVDMTGGAR